MVRCGGSSPQIYGKVELIRPPTKVVPRHLIAYLVGANATNSRFRQTHHPVVLVLQQLGDGLDKVRLHLTAIDDVEELLTEVEAQKLRLHSSPSRLPLAGPAPC